MADTSHRRSNIHDDDLVRYVMDEVTCYNIGDPMDRSINEVDHFFPLHYACENMAERFFSFARNRINLSGTCEADDALMRSWADLYLALEIQYDNDRRLRRISYNQDRLEWDNRSYGAAAFQDYFYSPVREYRRTGQRAHLRLLNRGWIRVPESKVCLLPGLIFAHHANRFFRIRSPNAPNIGIRSGSGTTRPRRSIHVPLLFPPSSALRFRHRGIFPCPDHLQTLHQQRALPRPPTHHYRQPAPARREGPSRALGSPLPGRLVQPPPFRHALALGSRSHRSVLGWEISRLGLGALREDASAGGRVRAGWLHAGCAVRIEESEEDMADAS